MPTNVTKTDSQPKDLAALFAAIEKIGHRLDKIENGRSTSEISNLRSEISNPQIPHPSLDKLNVAEAIADSIFSHYQKEKACQFEPDKPCDHCSMCNSRGF